MSFETIQNRTFTARLDCHYLLYVPESITERTLLAVTLHGYGSDPRMMLQLTGNMLGAEHVIASLQAPGAFFLSQNTPRSEVGYCWLTNQHAASAVRLHHDMLLHVFADVGRLYGIPAERRLLVGFPQPVGINYRFAATHPDATWGVIGICGGLPKNWEDGQYRRVSAALLHIARREDEFYPPDTTERYPERLRLRAADVEFHLMEGGHRFPSKAKPLVERWIERVFFNASPAASRVAAMPQ